MCTDIIISHPTSASGITVLLKQAINIDIYFFYFALQEQPGDKRIVSISRAWWTERNQAVTSFQFVQSLHSFEHRFLQMMTSRKSQLN